jgi:ribonuclease R
VQVARVDLEARRIEFRLVREQERKALIAGEAEPAPARKDKRKGESVEERRARVERTQGRSSHGSGRRDKGGGGSSGLNRARSRGRR